MKTENRTLVFYQTFANDCDDYHDPQWLLMHPGKSVDDFIAQHQSSHVGCDLLFAVSISADDAKRLHEALYMSAETKQFEDAASIVKTAGCGFN